MIKKIFLLISILTCALGVSAQRAPGTWTVLPMSATNFEAVQDTPDKVYYLTGGALYSYDKENNETVYYTPGSKLSDSGITTIKYNKDQKYLLCVYDNCNIDLIYDDGKVVNLPEIKDANLTSAKAVNYIYFGQGRIYLATSFGIVVFDDQNHHVVESGIYNTPINYIAEMGDYILIQAKNINPDDLAGYYLAYSHKNDRHNVVSKFKPIRSVGFNDWLVVSDNSYIATLNNTLWKTTIDFGNGTADVQSVGNQGALAGATNFEPCKDGYYLKGTNSFIVYNNQGEEQRRSDIPADFRSQMLSFWTSPSSVWAADTEGIGCYDMSQSTPTVLSEKYFPQSSKQFNNCFTYNSPDGSEVYFNGIGQSELHISGNPLGGYDVPILVESYDWDAGTFTPRYPTDIKDKYSSYQKLGLLYGGPGNLAIDPIDPSFIYTANNFDGLIVLKDRKVHYRYYKDNSPVYSNWGSRTYDVTFDNLGNLWVGMWHLTKGAVGSSNGSPYKVIPKESLEILKTNPQLLEDKDSNGQYKYWLQPSWPINDVGRPDMKLRFSSKTNKGIRLPHSGLGINWIGYDTKGTTSISDDVCVEYNIAVDQDNTQLGIEGCCIVEDKDGKFWIGTQTGVVVLEDLDQIAKQGTSTLYLKRPKVPRNDGTNFADYLLDTDKILCIAVDANNHKWIGTEKSGLYHVNEDGTEILENYTTDNSIMATNAITMVACNPHGNDVLIGTQEGLYLYNSNSAPAAESYSDVYAFPNPVRPEYTGWITIAGLMDKSLVKIADSQGNVVWQGKSEGGMAMWDGCDAAGNRVRSGVYMVMASQNNTGNASGAVAKIVVIN